MLRCFETDSHPQFRDCVPQEPPLLPLNNSIREAETLRSMVGYFTRLFGSVISVF